MKEFTAHGTRHTSHVTRHTAHGTIGALLRTDRSRPVPTVLIVCLMTFSMSYSQNIKVFEEWASRDGTQNFFIKAAVATDLSENVYVAGATLNASGDYDILLTKYNGSGDVVWTDQYDGSGHGDDAAFALTIDINENVFLTGSVWIGYADSNDVITIAYDSAGNRDWVEIWGGNHGGNDAGTSIALDADTIYVGGFVSDTNTGADFLALKYESDSTLLWSASYDEDTTKDMPTGVLAYGFGTLTLGGASITDTTDWDFLVVRFNADDGSLNNSYTSGNTQTGFVMVNGAAIDAGGYIYLTGTTWSPTSGFNILTVKLDDDLSLEWSKTWKSSGSQRDAGSDVAVDESGNVYVCGFTDTLGQGTNFVTIKYNSSGTEQWDKIWNSGSDSSDTAKAILVKTNGDVVVTGSSFDGTSLNYQTIKYDASGNQAWDIEYDSKYRMYDSPADIALDSNGNVIVSGQSMLPDTTWEYVTVKYVEVDVVAVPDTDSVYGSIRFIANHDQVADSGGNIIENVKYYQGNQSPSTYHMKDTVCLVFSSYGGDTIPDSMQRVDMLMDGNAGSIYPLKRESYHHNYYLAHTGNGRPKVPLYESLYQAEVWDHIDVMHTSNVAGMKYYFIVKPSQNPFEDGGDPSAIRLMFSGHDSLYINSGDSLIIQSAFGILAFPPPRIFQNDVSGNFEGMGEAAAFQVSGDTVVFTGIGEYDGNDYLIISMDGGGGQTTACNYLPTGNLFWSTYFGGSNIDFATDVVLGLDKTSYVTGETQSSDFPKTNAAQNKLSGNSDAFIAAFDKDAAPLWSTYYGGSSSESGTAITIDRGTQASKLYAAGSTQSTDLKMPLVNTGTYIQSGSTISSSSYLLEMDPAQGMLLWATWFGGEGSDILDLKLEHSTQSLYFCGKTDASGGNNYTCNPPANEDHVPRCSTGTHYFQSYYGGNTDGYLGAFNTFDNSLEWSTFWGGTEFDALTCLATDPVNHDVYVGGYSESDNVQTVTTLPCSVYSNGYYPLCNPTGSVAWFDPNNTAANNGQAIGIIAKFNADRELEWSTFFGGEEGTQVTDIVVDGQSVSYLLGEVYLPEAIGKDHSCGPNANGEFTICNNSSGTFYEKSAWLQGDPVDCFVARFNNSQMLEWSTLLGSDYQDKPGGLDVDDIGNIYVGGSAYQNTGGNSGPSNLDVLTFSGYYNQAEHSAYGKQEQHWDPYLFVFGPANTRTWVTWFGGDATTNGMGSDLVTGISVIGDRLALSGQTQSFCTPYKCPNTTSPYCVPTLNNFSKDAFVTYFDVDVLVSQEVRKLTHSESLHIFPNPGSGLFNVLISGTIYGVVHCDVYAISGNKIYSESQFVTSDQKEIKIDISDKPGGIYLVRMISGEKSFTGKLLKY